MYLEYYSQNIIGIIKLEYIKRGLALFNYSHKNFNSNEETISYIMEPFQYTHRNRSLEDYIATASGSHGENLFITKLIRNHEKQGWLTTYSIMRNPEDSKYNTHHLIAIHSLLDGLISGDDKIHVALTSESQSSSSRPKEPKGKATDRSLQEQSVKKQGPQSLARSGHKRKGPAIYVDDEAEEEFVQDTQENLRRESRLPSPKFTATNIVVPSAFKDGLVMWQCCLVGIVKESYLGPYGNYNPNATGGINQTTSLNNANLSLTLALDQNTLDLLRHLDDDIQQHSDFKGPSFNKYYGILRGKDTKELWPRLKLLIPRWKWMKDGRGIPEEFDDQSDPERKYRSYAKESVPRPSEELDRFARAAPDGLRPIKRDQIPVGSLVEVTVSFELWRNESNATCGVNVVLDDLILVSEKYEHVSKRGLFCFERPLKIAMTNFPFNICPGEE